MILLVAICVCGPLDASAWTGGGGITPSGTPVVDGGLVLWDGTSGFVVKDGGLSPTFSNLTITGTIDASGAAIWTLPVGTDLDAFIASASCEAGDTLVLGSGDYTVTDDIDVTKSLTIRGQKGQTRIVCVTDSKIVFHVTASDVTIADLGIDVTASGTYGIQPDGTGGTVLSDVNIRNCNITLNSHAGTQYAVWYNDAGGEVRDCVIAATSSSGACYAIQHRNNVSAEATTTTKLYNVSGSASGATFAKGAYVFDSGASQDNFMYIYNSTFVVTEGGAAASTGIEAQGADAYMYAENVVVSATDTDVVNTSASPMLQLRDCTLVNGTTSGTITYDGQVVTDQLSASGNITQTGAASTNYFTGKLGVGIASPAQVLHSEKVAAGTSEHIAAQFTGKSSDTGIAAGSGVAIKFELEGNAGAMTQLGEIAYTSEDASGNNAGLRFTTSDTTDAMVINSSGNVGIGTNLPAAKLEINGQVILDNHLGGGAQMLWWFDGTNEYKQIVGNASIQTNVLAQP
ncbi:hypothetical protein N9937_01585 [bacterium]|nr:hypothetical protein [bacterium]